MLEDLTSLEAARWVVKDTIRKQGHKVSWYKADEIAKAAKALLTTDKEHVMNTLAIINLARRYAKNIVTKKYQIPVWNSKISKEVRAEAEALARSKRIMALARINWTKANAKKAEA